MGISAGVPARSVKRRAIVVVVAGLCLLAVGGGLYVGLFGVGNKQVHTVIYNHRTDYVCSDSHHLVFTEAGIALCEGSKFLGPDGFTGDELEEAADLIRVVANDGKIDKAEQRRLDDLSERISRNHGESSKPHSSAGLVTMGAGLLAGCCLVLIALISRSLRRTEEDQQA
jgi:hypothetical protein